MQYYYNMKYPYILHTYNVYDNKRQNFFKIIFYGKSISQKLCRLFKKKSPKNELYDLTIRSSLSDHQNIAPIHQ